MAEGERDIVAHESHLARRVGRLFRFERTGRLGERPPELAGRILDRRRELIDALIRIDAARRNLQMPISPELRQAAEALWRETGETRRVADMRLEGLRADLLIARGEGIPTGIRGLPVGRVIGRG